MPNGGAQQAQKPPISNVKNLYGYFMYNDINYEKKLDETRLIKQTESSLGN